MKFPSAMELILLFSSFIIGMRFPDWDFKMKIKHRNILTHSPIVLWVMIYFYKQQSSNAIFEYFIIGFSLAIGIHLLFDFFPKGWAMGALIYLPFVDICMGVKLSKLIIFLSSMCSFYLAIHYTKTEEVVYILIVLSIVTFLKNIVKEGKFFRPFSIFATVFLILSSVKFPEIKNRAYMITLEASSEIQKRIIK